MLYRVTLLAVALAILAGCSKPIEPPQKFPAVTGTVTMDSSPLPGATVTFIPTAAGDRGSATTDDAGKYALKGLRGGEGVPQGEYKVTVSRWLMKDGKLPPPNTDVVTSGAAESLPPTCSDPIKTTLKASVGASGGSFDFALKSR